MKFGLHLPTVAGSEHDLRFVNSWRRLAADPAAREECNAIKRRPDDREADKSTFFDRIAVG